MRRSTSSYADMEHNPLDFPASRPFLLGMTDKAALQGKAICSRTSRCSRVFRRRPIESAVGREAGARHRLDGRRSSTVSIRPSRRSRPSARCATRRCAAPTRPEPSGIRGYGTAAAAYAWGVTRAEYERRADVWPLNPDGDLLAIVMIESAEGLKNVDDDGGRAGVGALFPRRLDLSRSLGVPPTSPELETAFQQILAACKRANVPCGITPRQRRGSSRAAFAKAGASSARRCRRSPPDARCSASSADSRIDDSRRAERSRRRGSVNGGRRLRRAAHDRVDLRVVVAERAVAELALELDVALLGEQALDLVRAEHAHDARETLRRAAAVVRDGARREQANRVTARTASATAPRRPSSRELVDRDRRRASGRRLERVGRALLAVARQRPAAAAPRRVARRCARRAASSSCSDCAKYDSRHSSSLLARERHDALEEAVRACPCRDSRRAGLRRAAARLARRRLNDAMPRTR